MGYLSEDSFLIYVDRHRTFPSKWLVDMQCTEHRCYKSGKLEARIGYNGFIKDLRLLSGISLV